MRSTLAWFEPCVAIALFIMSNNVASVGSTVETWPLFFARARTLTLPVHPPTVQPYWKTPLCAAGVSVCRVVADVIGRRNSS